MIMEYASILIEFIVAIGGVVGVILTAKSNFNKMSADLDKRIDLLKSDDKARNEALNKDISRLNNEIAEINNELKRTNDVVITITELKGEIKLIQAEVEFLKQRKGQ